MLGAIATSRRLFSQVVLYTWASVIFSLLLAPMGWAGVVYTATAAVSGGWFVYEAHKLYRDSQRPDFTDKKAMRVFHLSITYLTLIFVDLDLKSTRLNSSHVANSY